MPSAPMDGLTASRRRWQSKAALFLSTYPFMFTQARGKGFSWEFVNHCCCPDLFSLEAFCCWAFMCKLARIFLNLNFKKSTFVLRPAAALGPGLKEGKKRSISALSIVILEKRRWRNNKVSFSIFQMRW